MDYRVTGDMLKIENLVMISLHNQPVEIQTGIMESIKNTTFCQQEIAGRLNSITYCNNSGCKTWSENSAYD